MKAILTIITLLFSTSLFAQKLVKDEIDEFTGAKVRETSWEWFADSWSGKGSYKFRIRKVDSSYIMDFKIMLPSGDVFSINKDAPLMLKLDNGDIVKLQAREYTITCRGCGATGLMGSDAQGLNASFNVSPAQLQQIYDSIPTKLRLYTSEGYTECPIKQKQVDNIKETIYLIAS